MKKKLKNTEDMMDVVQLNVAVRRLEARLDEMEQKAEINVLRIVQDELHRLKHLMRGLLALLRIRITKESDAAGRMDDVFYANLGSLRRRVASKDIEDWHSYARLYAPPEEINQGDHY